MRVKEAASIVVNMPKKKHKHAKKNRVAADLPGCLLFLYFVLCICLVI